MSPSVRRGRRLRGSAAVEFALVAPVLALLGVAVLDVVDFLRVALRVERVAGELVNVVAQRQTLREADFATLFDLAARIADPHGVTGGAGAVVLSGLANEDGELRVLWQRRAGGAGFASAFGAEGGAATLPAEAAGLRFERDQGAVAAEVFLRREPWILSRAWLGAAAFSDLRSYALQRPRAVSILRVTP